MKANQAVHSVATMCRVLGVSAGGYYAWQRRGVSARDRQDEALLEQIRRFHRQSDGTYGAPRILRDLRATVQEGRNFLLLGETGTGKELFARLIHASGPVADGPGQPAPRRLGAAA